MKKLALKSILPHAIAVAIFLVISFLYFSPDVFQGKTILGHDSRTGMAQDLRDYKNETGEISYWSGTMFSGMPAYQIGPDYKSTRVVFQVRKSLGLEFPIPVGYVFIMLLGFYIMLLVFGARTDLAILGAIGYAFSSYFFIIIGAGHIFKLLVLAYIPPTIAGIALIYKGKYWLGGIVTAFFAALQIFSNHVQMSYYFVFVIAAYIIYEFFRYLKKNNLKGFIKASAVLCVAGLIAIAVNISNLYHTWDYSKQTMRGGTELTQNIANQTNKGLNLEYMTQWSYGIGETWSLLIPNVKGGGTDYIGNKPENLKSVAPQLKPYIEQQNAYWGNQPFTSGPVYAGAIFVLFFVMAMFLLKTRLKWALFAVFVLTVMLAWGNNMMWLTTLFANYFPMYSKFRAVSSILVVAEFIIPLLAILLLAKIVDKPEIIKANKNKVYAAFGITAGFALVFAIVPNLFFNFLSGAEKETFYAQAQQYPEALQFIDELEKVRIGIFRADALRTVGFILAAGVVLFLYSKRKLKSSLFVVLIGVLCIADMWSVNKRYLGEKDFISKSKVKNFSSFFPKSPADIAILKDKDINYRVFNTTADAFNESNTSFYHKSVGGYHAAKLSRYNDLISVYLSKGDMNVLNMLNTKYFIVRGEDNKPQAQLNPNALGNAWFIDKLIWVDTPDEELSLLGELDLSTTAVIDKRFEPILQGKLFATDSVSSIKQTMYQPNELHYKASLGTDNFIVFSEIYYSPGWHAYIDGVETDIVRVNYVLRGLFVPKGEHNIEFVFKPQSLKTTESIAYIAMIIFVLSLAGYIVFSIRKKPVTKD